MAIAMSKRLCMSHQQRGMMAAPRGNLVPSCFRGADKRRRSFHHADIVSSFLRHKSNPSGAMTNQCGVFVARQRLTAKPCATPRWYSTAAARATLAPSTRARIHSRASLGTPNAAEPGETAPDQRR